MQKFHQGITYWNHNGKHQKKYELMYEELVPKRGQSDTKSGELMRSMGNLYYDVYNNGGCNIKDSYKAEVELIKEALGRKTLPAHGNFEGWEKVVNAIIELVAKTFKSEKGQLITSAEATEVNRMGDKIHKSLRDINDIVGSSQWKRLKGRKMPTKVSEAFTQMEKTLEKAFSPACTLNVGFTGRDHADWVKRIRR